MDNTGTKILSVVELLPLQSQSETEQPVTISDIKDDQKIFDIEEMIQDIRYELADYQDDHAKRLILVKVGSIEDMTMEKFSRYACQASMLKEMGAQQRTRLSFMNSDSSNHSAVLQTLLAASKPDERYAVMEQYIQRQVAKTIKIPVSSINAKVSMGALGFDSLTAAELQKQIESDLAIFLPRLIFMRELTMVQLGEWILEQMPRENSACVPSLAESQSACLSEVISLKDTSHLPSSSPLGLEKLWILKQFASDCPVHNIPYAIEAIQSWMQNTGFAPDIALWGRYRFHVGSSAWSRCL